MRFFTLLPALALVTFLLLIPLPVSEASRRWPALLYELENAAHLVVFAWLTWLVWRTLRPRLGKQERLAWPLTFIIIVTFGGITEWVQSLVGRDSSWIDLGNDALGALFTLLWVAAQESGPRARAARRRTLAAAAALCVAVAFAPLVWTLAAYANRSAKSPILWRVDSALFERFSTWQGGQFPGLVLQEPVADWTAFRLLEVDVQSIAAKPLGVTVRVHDLLHNQQYLDRFNEEFWLQPGEARTLRIAVDRIREAPETRSMDLRAIRGILIFQELAGEPPHFRVTEVRLVR